MQETTDTPGDDPLIGPELDPEMQQQMNLDLTVAASRGSTSDVLRLLALGADPSDGKALVRAVLKERNDVVRILLEDGRTDPNVALKLVACIDSDEMFRLILGNNRVDPTVDNNTPIRHAMIFGVPSFVTLLLEYDDRVDPPLDQIVSFVRGGYVSPALFSKILDRIERLHGPSVYAIFDGVDLRGPGIFGDVLDPELPDILVRHRTWSRVRAAWVGSVMRAPAFVPVSTEPPTHRAKYGL